MNRFPILTFLCAMLLLALVPSCITDEFTDSPSDRLSFSTDTLSFDTVFTGVGTPTARLRIYNHAKKAINISSIRMKEADSRFSINVDGVSGRDFRDVEIRGGDSIFVFVECYIPQSDTNTPTLVEDQLQFVSNGNTQSVLLQAYGQNVTRLRGLTITEDMTLTPDRPYVVFDSLNVAQGATLHILPGTMLLFHDKAALNVRGRIEAVGNAEGIIQMRGDRLDEVLPNTGYDILAGQWKGMRIYPESFGNRLEYVNLRSTERGVEVDSCADLSQRKLLLVNSWLHNSQSSALRSDFAWVDAYGCCFSEAAESVVNLRGGKHDFSQCTLSNYYLFSAISGPLLSLTHCLPTEQEESGVTLPLMEARFANSILYGLPSDISPGDLTGSNVYLDYVLLKSVGEDDEHFRHCIRDADPLFLTDRPRYYFDYRVRPDSPALHAGDPALVNPLTLRDMTGADRLSDGAPTLGAYALPAEPAQEAQNSRF